MGLDPLSPIAPARVRVLLVPVGRVKRSRFLAFVDRLRPHNVVRLGDVSADARPNRNMFSPLAFPSGLMLYDLSVSLPPGSHSPLAPFELFREPLVVIGVVDGVELGQLLGAVASEEGAYDALGQGVEELMDQFPKALVHRLLLFDHTPAASSRLPPEGIMTVPPPELVKITTMKTVMCDITSLLLAEMTTFAKSLQGLPSIESPSTSDGSHIHNGFPPGHGSQPEVWGRRGSETTPHSGSVSPATAAERAHHRMSMPAQLPSSAEGYSGAIAGSRSKSPPSRTRTPPPTTFDEIAGQGGSPNKNSLPSTLNRSSAGSVLRESSHDRISVHGFGSGSLSERARNKGKGRVGVVIGALYLHAGRWGDAVRELVESATIAKANSDHLWHAKALENILVGLLMLAWAGMDFQIPQICYPMAEKASAPSIKSQSSSTGGSDAGASQSPNAPNRLVSLQNLTSLLPDLLNTILNLYIRASNFTGESLPQLAFSESCIRFSKLLCAVHLSNGKLDDQALKLAVLNAPLLEKPRLRIPRISRKKAFVLRELLSVLTPGLVQARKLGAAEMGVHPAAGLAALNAVGGGAGAGALDLGQGDVEHGLVDLLGVLGRTYGVVAATAPRTDPTDTDAAGFDDSQAASQRLDGDSDEAVVARILQDATLRSFGSHALKLNILRHCINLCEALPDFHGVLRFTTELLRTAGSGIAPRADSDEGSTSLTRDEQVRLATNISRTVGAARKLGLRGIEAEYWDEFLARGVELLEPAAWKIPVLHSRSELESAGAVVETKEKSPFIYNPFLKRPDAAAAEKVLVVAEYAEFKITLQNPFEFDIEIERICLESTGVKFDPTDQGTVIGAYRTKMLSLFGVPRGAGTLTIAGCKVKIRGCRERRFPIFSEPWSPQQDTKIKSTGLAASERDSPRPISMTTGPMTSTSSASPGPKPSSLTLSVIPEQPVLVVKSTNLPQSAVMLLDGERKAFTITLQNLSSTVPVDLLLFAAQDSTAGPLQAAMNSKDILSAELYELELLFSHKEALRWRRENDTRPSIGPGESKAIEVEVLGKPGLTGGVVHLDYAHLGTCPEQATEIFYSRQVTVPITVTVNASIELVRADVIRCAPTSVWPKSIDQTRAISGKTDEPGAVRSSTAERTEHRHRDLLRGLGFQEDDRDHCLLLLDFRNAWPTALTVTLQLRSPTDGENAETWVDAYTLTEVIQSGHTSRVVLPLPRIFLKNSHAPIPTLNPANKRQFVLGASKLSPEAERASREVFWYRQEILKLLRGTWEEKGSNARRGDIELRNMKLSARMVDAVKIDDVEIEWAITNSESADTEDRSVRQTGRSAFNVPTEEFLTLRTRIHNRTSEPIYPLLRLQPSLRHQPHGVALDISKRLIWNGLLQQALPLLGAGEETEVELGVCVLCRGEFEIGAQVEEARLCPAPAEDEAEAKPKPTLVDRALGVRGRRCWYARERCVLLARDDA
ncbi:MAG: hypothetical protein M1832_003075 [Thelocarpon impressellum]|nr:MAG: hypothetical protein M1832_003075 [Thelocarpon impressellum]